MNCIRLIFCFSFIISILSCNTGGNNESANTSDPDNNISNNDNNNNKQNNENVDYNQNEQDASNEQENKKQIDWKDGNSYSYDYTETITKTDSLGNEEEITVYKQNKPSDADVYCKPKICKWCGKESTAYNYKIEEYPNINWLRGEPDLGSIIGMLGSIFDGIHYYDLENKKIRTEWNVKCDYYGPDEFCSNKCEYEYRNR